MLAEKPFLHGSQREICQHTKWAAYGNLNCQKLTNGFVLVEPLKWLKVPWLTRKKKTEKAHGG
nr:MAG TPA: hypothetical protein [Caudoviricetes sp.]